MTNFNEYANFIWQIAELLRGPYRPNEYKYVILPLTVLRRLDCLLEPTKDEVLAKYEELEQGSIETYDILLAPNKGIDEKAIYALLVWNDQVCEGVILKYLIKEEDVLWAVPANGQLRPKPVSRLGDRVEVFGRVIGVSKVV